MCKEVMRFRLRLSLRIDVKGKICREGRVFLKQNIVTRDRILILISGFFYFASPMLVTPLITGFSENLGASAALMGVIGGLMNICSLFCRPFVGNLTDKISKYKLSFIGAVLMAAASVGYAVAQSPLFIVAARIVNGIGFSLCSVCISTWMSTLLPKEKIGSGMGIYGAMNALAMAAAPAVGVSLYERIGYRPAFLVAAAFSILIVVVIQFVQNKGEPVSVSKEEKENQEKRRVQVVEKKVIPIAFIIMLFAIPYCATQSF